MRRSARWALPVAAVLALFALLLAETLSVKVKTTAVRRDPRFTAPILATLQAGDPVEKLEAREGWVKVRTKAGIVGWVHSTAVEARKAGLTAMDRTMKTQASSSEVALAAKGFNKQVEDKFRAGNPAADFAAVDALEKVKPSAAEIEAFMKEGKLGELGGGR